ncbi:amidohydrolase family protein [Pseudooceanicola sp. CBS1P-1]|uniref:Amidohydrolase family protein n=1 Tax=Pseudooceanicola albus TaxID=2692189 RepID=A0A6L7G231_9RHOB|nr:MULTISPECIES: amidohydrolase family protein [Pseudooceanicola]MBT9383734.1 amidohydrolase family protein [Pseudooceanicola endophyticus]MXN17588.1 amidohydrolase family protein [Pseudooceanicola albus]
MQSELIGAPKIDCHLHLFDPARFPYAPDALYRPQGAEIATREQLLAVFASAGVERALLVQPTSGYGTDNSAMLDAIARSGGLWKGIALVAPDISHDALADLKAQGIVGVAYLMAGAAPGAFRDHAALTEKLVDLDMVLDIQFEGDGIFEALEVIGDSPVRLAIDHCGRPDLRAGIDSPAFRALLALSERAAPTVLKLSGQHKFAPFPHPFTAADPFLAELLGAYSPARTVWGSDWPFLRVEERVDYGPLLPLVARQLPDPDDRDQVFRRTALGMFWDTVPTGAS